MTAHEAFLRVYEPLAAFEGAERKHWEAYAATGAAPSTAEGPQLERAAAVRASTGAAARAVPELEEHAYVTEVDGVTLVCPWRTRLRALEGLEDFVSGLPDLVTGAFVPLELAASAGEQVQQWRADHPAARNHQLSCTWQVPLRWFVLFEDTEREVRLGVPAAAGASAPGRPVGRALVYRSAMSRARRRTARALAVLNRSVDDGAVLAVTAGVEDLGRWLEEFHPRSMVELDYGGLVHLLDDAELGQDQSARDVALALAALGEGQAERAAAAYGRVTARMKALQAVETAN